jgi:hypothetical protein
VLQEGLAGRLEALTHREEIAMPYATKRSSKSATSRSFRPSSNTDRAAPKRTAGDAEFFCRSRSVRTASSPRPRLDALLEACGVSTRFKVITPRQPARRKGARMIGRRAFSPYWLTTISVRLADITIVTRLLQMSEPRHSRRIQIYDRLLCANPSFRFLGCGAGRRAQSWTEIP